MKATPFVVEATAPQQMVSRAVAEPAAHEPSLEALELSQESLRERASMSTELMDEILERENYSYSFRHWGINE